MKTFEVKKEITIWVIMLLPIIYLFMVWNKMPEIVPTHFGIDGTPNDWSHRSVLIYLVGGMTLGMYLIFLIIPVIDPKDKIKAMGNKYFKLKFVLMLAMALLATLVVHAALTGSIGGNTIFLIAGGMFLFLGNYMQTVKPNYFIGIRTPWTLENETVWSKTHRLAGRLYFIAGLVIIILSFVVKNALTYIFVPLILSATIVPVVYSYILFRKVKKEVNGAS
ncbi:MAG: hypothetical protein K0Q79_266 [Flavipsychrobacter sp.]|jgi:uncharacterized membrane protein|nr:hypothetical protein [Flavipsychrobacter sp.]